MSLKHVEQVARDLITYKMRIEHNNEKSDIEIEVAGNRLRDMSIPNSLENSEILNQRVSAPI